MENDSLRRHFELNKSETEALFSLQYWLAREDVDRVPDKEKQEKRLEWVEEWASSVFMKKWFGLSDDKPKKAETVFNRISAIRSIQKKKIVFFEAMIFTPYFNLERRHIANVQLEDFEMESFSKARRKAIRKFIIKESIDPVLIERAADRYEEAIKGIADRGTFAKKIGVGLLVAAGVALTAGWAAPFIGAAIGGFMGLTGAAATSAGLAFLGGGALAAGGFGMAGGTFVVVGGGALLGGSFGVLSANRNLFFQHRIILQQLAKLETVLVCFLSDEEDYRQHLTQVSIEYIQMIDKLAVEIKDPGLEDNERAGLEKSLLLYKNAAKRIEELKEL